MNKKLLVSLLLGLVGLQLLTGRVNATEVVTPTEATDEQVVMIEVLGREDCVHCRDEKEFFDQLQNERQDFTVKYFDIVKEVESRALFEEVTRLEGLPKATPVTLIGSAVIQGFDKPETTGAQFKGLIDQAKKSEQYTFTELITLGGSGAAQKVEGGGCEDDGLCIVDTPLLVSVPFVGTVDIKQYSLPFLSVVLGFVDGFNPCAMWVLVTFLLILTQVGDRRKMWQVAGLFILAEAVMYYLILNVWYSVWDFVGLDYIVTPLIGLLALGSGVYFLREWYKSEVVCKVVGMEERTKTKSRIQRLVSGKMTIPVIIGIIGLALSVNIIEFACSIGIPQAFTKILDLNALNFVWRQIYMAIYILFYMIDDLIVFGIALYSIEKIGLTTKYAKFSHLVGGILMLLLGILLLFKPDWLVF